MVVVVDGAGFDSVFQSCICLQGKTLLPYCRGVLALIGGTGSIGSGYRQQRCFGDGFLRAIAVQKLQNALWFVVLVPDFFGILRNVS